MDNPVIRRLKQQHRHLLRVGRFRHELAGHDDLHIGGLRRPREAEQQGRGGGDLPFQRLVLQIDEDGKRDHAEAEQHHPAVPAGKGGERRPDLVEQEENGAANQPAPSAEKQPRVVHQQRARHHDRDDQRDGKGEARTEINHQRKIERVARADREQLERGERLARENDRGDSEQKEQADDRADLEELEQRAIKIAALDDAGRERIRGEEILALPNHALIAAGNRPVATLEMQRGQIVPLKHDAEMFHRLRRRAVHPVGHTFQRRRLIGDVDVHRPMRRERSAPKPRVLGILLQARRGGLQLQPARLQGRPGLARRVRMRAFEEHKHRLIESVRQHMARVKFPSHIDDRPQAAVVPASPHLEGDLRGLRLRGFDHVHVVAQLANHHARGFLDQLRFRGAHRLADKLRPLLHQHVQPEEAERNGDPAHQPRTDQSAERSHGAHAGGGGILGSAHKLSRIGLRRAVPVRSSALREYPTGVARCAHPVTPCGCLPARVEMVEKPAHRRKTPHPRQRRRHRCRRAQSPRPETPSEPPAIRDRRSVTRSERLRDSMRRPMIRCRADEIRQPPPATQCHKSATPSASVMDAVTGAAPPSAPSPPHPGPGNRTQPADFLGACHSCSPVCRSSSRATARPA